MSTWLEPRRGRVIRLTFYEAAGRFAYTARGGGEDACTCVYVYTRNAHVRTLNDRKIPTVTLAMYRNITNITGNNIADGRRERGWIDEGQTRTVT